MEHRGLGAALALPCALLALLALLPGCTTPTTTLRNPSTGQVVTCGGNTSSSIAGGLVGYSIQQSSDQDCVRNHLGQGFVQVR